MGKSFNAKTGCSPRGISADSYKNVCQYSFDTRLMGHPAGSPDKLDKLDESVCNKQSPAVLGILLLIQHRQGVVIGSGDRALGRKARVPGFWRSVESAPRVIAPQNRMHLTQSPRRSKRQPGHALDQADSKHRKKPQPGRAQDQSRSKRRKKPQPRPTQE